MSLMGKRFGKVIVVEKLITSKGTSNWKVQCECGKVKGPYRTLQLETGQIVSCGRCGPTKHGDSRTKFYEIWYSMVLRCKDGNHPDSKFYYYKGIRVCNEWKDLKTGYVTFRTDMKEEYNKHVKEFGQKDTTIDRINNSKGYYKENCRWVTWKEQYLNKDRIKVKKFKATRILDDYVEESDNQADFERKYHVHQSSISKCLTNFLDYEKYNTVKGWKFEPIELNKKGEK